MIARFTAVFGWAVLGWLAGLGWAGWAGCFGLAGLGWLGCIQNG